MTASAETAQTRVALRTLTNGTRWAALACGVALGVASGCGGTDGNAASTAEVEAALTARGDVQSVSCETLGTEQVEDVEQTVYMCAFSEEKDDSGRMRAANRCFVLSAEGAVTDVTRVLRERGSCPATSP